MTPGDKVLVEFNRDHWPVTRATYIYEGRDDHGWWVRRKDGVQRYFLREDITSITVVQTGDVEETPH